MLDAIGSASWNVAASCMGQVSMMGTAVEQVASDPKAQMTLGSAACGACAAGSCGGVIAAIVGGFLGGLLGIVPAFFTFGLSIPFCAVLGAVIGFCMGVTVGSIA